MAGTHTSTGFGPSRDTRRMAWLLRILAVISIVYYTGMVAYVGFYLSFYLFWPLLSGLLFGVAEFLLRRGRVMTLPGWAGPIVIAVLVVAALFFLTVQGLILRTALNKPQPGLPVLIVLGGQIDENGPMAILKDRLDEAYDYAEDNPDTVLIVTGGQGDNEPRPEAHAMRDYLADRGLDPARILVEDRSTNTHENMVFALELLPKDTDRTGIVSSNYHMYRAIRLAKTAGIPEPQAVPAPSSRFLYVHNALREFFSLIKDVATGNI